eukprot:scaffold5259_cov168-Ochromonas_danica.AAC.12
MQGMEQNHTVVVIVITSATNFLTSGLCGYLILGEDLTSSWISGSLMIMLGMFFVAMSQGPSNKRPLPTTTTTTTSSTTSSSTSTGGLPGMMTSSSSRRRRKIG